MTAVWNTLIFSISAVTLTACQSAAHSADKKMKVIVENCQQGTPESLIACTVGGKIVEVGVKEDFVRTCHELASHSLVRREGYLYDGIGLLSDDAVTAWVYANDLVQQHSQSELSSLKIALFDERMKGFGIAEWSDRCSKGYYAALELVKRSEGLGGN